MTDSWRGNGEERVLLGVEKHILHGRTPLRLLHVHRVSVSDLDESDTAQSSEIGTQVQGTLHFLFYLDKDCDLGDWPDSIQSPTGRPDPHTQ